jgi:hypothetical protein
MNMFHSKSLAFHDSIPELTRHSLGITKAIEESRRRSRVREREREREKDSKGKS